MATPERQIEFLSNLQRLLAEGSFVSTYKYALLLALADLSVELGRDDDAPLEISTLRIGEKFAEYYWRQCVPYLPTRDEDGVLKQNTGEPPKIIKLLQDARNGCEDSLANLRRDERAWKATVMQVAAQVRKMPLWKLQTVGTQRLDFLYDNTGRGINVTLKPGVGFCFRKHYSLIVDLVKGAWARYIRRYNAHRLEEKTDLHEFLFGSERANLDVVRPILRELQSGECFYCHRQLCEEAEQVDHFLPWSRYPVDLGHNFVLAHASCNGRKSDHLPAAQHLNAWAVHNKRLGRDKGREFDRRGVVHDLPTSARVIDWAYRQAGELRGLTWVRAKELEPLPASWREPLLTLLN